MAETSRKGMQVPVSMNLEERAFLEELQAERNAPSLAAIFRELIAGAMTLYSLPAYQAARIREDMAKRKVDVIGYMQELIAMRYEALAREDAARGAKPRK